MAITYFATHKSLTAEMESKKTVDYLLDNLLILKCFPIKKRPKVLFEILSNLSKALKNATNHRTKRR
jgi:hypothetical protein